MRSLKFKQNLNTRQMSLTGHGTSISRGQRRTIFDMPEPRDQHRKAPARMYHHNSSKFRYRDNPRQFPINSSKDHPTPPPNSFINRTDETKDMIKKATQQIDNQIEEVKDKIERHKHRQQEFHQLHLKFVIND